MSGTPLEIFPPLTCALNKNGTLEGKEVTVYLDAIRKSVKKYGMKTADQLSAAEFNIGHQGPPGSDKCVGI